MYSNIFSSEIRQQNRTEQNRTEQNPYRASFGRRTELLQNLFQLQNKILQSLFQSFNRAIIGYTKQNIIFNYFNFFMQFSNFINAHPSGHKARGYAFLSLSNTGFDFRTTPLLFNSINKFLLTNLKIKKIFL